MIGRSFNDAPSGKRALAREEILAIAHEAYFSIGLTTGIVEANEDFAAKLNFLLGEATNPRAIFERVHPDDKAKFEALFAGIGSDEIETGEARLRVAAAGQYHWLRLRAAKFRGGSQSEHRIIGSLSNIDPEKEELLHAALAIADAAVWEYDPTAGKFYGSERLAALAGRDHVDGEWVRDFASTLHPDDAETFRAEASKFWAGITDRVAIDHRVRQSDGGYRWLRSYISRIGERGGNGRRVIGFLKDIGSLKEAELAARDAEERALAANAAKSQFLATMSHEIRTPMNGVLGMASALRASNLSTDQRKMLAIIQSSGEDLLALLNDLLDMSKAEAGKIELHETAFFLPDLVRKAVVLFSESALATRTVLKVEVARSAEVRLNGDAMRIRQILNNLISNAVKFTDRGEITVSVERAFPLEGIPQTIIRVADTGIGIAPDKIGKLFNEFSQADPTVRRRYEGTGLGLTISRRLAERMEGTITLDSKLGSGSVFCVTLPLVEAECAPVATDASLTLPREGACAMRVLVAEDNRKNQLIIEKMLSAAGAKIVFADDGQEAVARWHEIEIDLILMDVRMPVADGLWASREIRSRELSEGRARTPIIALTADATDDGMREALEAGMDAHVAKPIQARSLLETIASVIRL